MWQTPQSSLFLVTGLEQNQAIMNNGCYFAWNTPMDVARGQAPFGWFPINNPRQSQRESPLSPFLKQE